jgi:CPA2 family monovalent cation:H+ antiporter-2
MFAVVQVDPILSTFVILSLVIILVGFVLRILRQPSIITYILVGIVVGPFGLGIVTDEVLITNLGSLGLVLLLFFIGMEIHLPDLIANWKVSVIGTLIEVILSIFFIWIIGQYYDWPLERIIMLGFVISLSSTAVIIKLLEERNELATKPGQFVLGILLIQDIIIVPMIILLGYLGGNQPSGLDLLKQLIGGLLIVGILVYILKKKEIVLPFKGYIRKDHEMQVFIAFTLCFGFSLITAWLGLSSALGAFVAGIIVSSTRSERWVIESLHAFKIFFVALFFVSIGLLIDLEFLRKNLMIIAVLVAVIFVLNNSINGIALRMFCKDWRISLYSGALLSQVGEFSFIIGFTGFQLGIIGDYTYQLTLSIIAMSLLLSPFWIELIRRLTRISLTKEN